MREYPQERRRCTGVGGKLRWPAMANRLEAYCALLFWMSALSSGVGLEDPQPKCEHAAPRPGTHYVCDNPQNPCYCHLEPNVPGSPPGEYYRKEAAAGERKVWVDPRHKLYYCSEKRPAKLSKQAL